MARSKYCCLVIEYSSFLTLVFYLFAFLLFCLDLTLTFYRRDYVFISFNSTSCIILDDNLDVRITKPLIELTSAFLMYFLLFLLLIFYECVRNSHWEYAIQLDSDGRFYELYNHVISNYPKCPLSDYETSSAHCCQYKSFLPTRHWIFHSEADRQYPPTTYKFIQVLMMWFCSIIQITILYFAPCFSQGKISYSNYEFMAFIYSFYTISFSICLWSITIISTVMEWKIERFYKFFEKSIYTFITFNLKIGCYHANSFMKLIGSNGIAYLVRMGDICGTAKLHYLLMVLICEYYRMNDLPFPLEERWDNFENDFLEYIYSGKKSGDTSLIDSILNSSTYEHFDDLEAQKSVSEVES